MTPLPELGCACATIRRAARLVTQLYDEELRGIAEASQFALLSVVAARPGITQTALATSLGMDKTTVSRNLAVMKRNGWIAASELQATPEGQALLRGARPAWQRAQDRMRGAMTTEQWELMWRTLRDVTTAAMLTRNQNQEQT